MALAAALVLAAVIASVVGFALGTYGHVRWRVVALLIAAVGLVGEGWVVATREPTHVAALTGVIAVVVGGAVFVVTEIRMEHVSQRARLQRAREARAARGLPPSDPMG